MVYKCLSCKANALLQILQTDLSFGREYTAAIEAKQVGEYWGEFRGYFTLSRWLKNGYTHSSLDMKSWNLFCVFFN